MRFVSKGPINNKLADDSLLLNGWQAIIWTNDGSFTDTYMHHSASMSWRIIEATWSIYMCYLLLWDIFDTCNGLMPVWFQAITWTNTEFCHWNPWGQNSIKLNPKRQSFLSWKWIWTCYLQNGDNVVPPSMRYHWSYIYVALNHWWCPRFWCMWNNFDGFVQDCSISSALALEILQSCTKLSIWPQERLTTAHISIRWWCSAYDNAFQVLLWCWWGNARETQHRRSSLLPQPINIYRRYYQ